jgi:hypothetical protein
VQDRTAMDAAVGDDITCGITHLERQRAHPHCSNAFRVRGHLGEIESAQTPGVDSISGPPTRAAGLRRDFRFPTGPALGRASLTVATVKAGNGNHRCTTWRVAQSDGSDGRRIASGKQCRSPGRLRTSTRSVRCQDRFDPSETSRRPQ